jgi:hypothetical protein
MVKILFLYDRRGGRRWCEPVGPVSSCRRTPPGATFLAGRAGSGSIEVAVRSGSLSRRSRDGAEGPCEQKEECQLNCSRTTAGNAGKGQAREMRCRMIPIQSSRQEILALEASSKASRRRIAGSCGLSPGPAGAPFGLDEDANASQPTLERARIPGPSLERAACPEMLLERKERIL